MQNIEKTKLKFIKVFAIEYFKKPINKLDKSELEICSSLAEFWAYVTTVLPDDHSQFTIFDFVGSVVDKETKKNKIVLPPDVTLHAKNQVCQLCWGMSWDVINKQNKTKDKKEMMAFLRTHSKMNDMLQEGKNVVIYGQSPKPIGRTLLASIIMKEAIKLRITKRAREHTYDWIDFNTLVAASKNDSFDFFIDRYNNKLPTILVLKFDINDPGISIEHTFGVGLNKIIESSRTYKIPLMEEKKYEDG